MHCRALAPVFLCLAVLAASALVTSSSCVERKPPIDASAFQALCDGGDGAKGDAIDCDTGTPAAAIAVALGNGMLGSCPATCLFDLDHPLDHAWSWDEGRNCWASQTSSADDNITCLRSAPHRRAVAVAKRLCPKVQQQTDALVSCQGCHLQWPTKAGTHTE
eukprot:m.308444 g.308444  ORF g.308444 m.308444 type:complete len:162 (+) comp19633_c1_seq3:299-784(+)